MEIAPERWCITSPLRLPALIAGAILASHYFSASCIHGLQSYLEIVLDFDLRREGCGTESPMMIEEGRAGPKLRWAPWKPPLHRRLGPPCSPHCANGYSGVWPSG